MPSFMRLVHENILPDVARRLMLTVKNERGDVTVLGGNKLDLNEVVELTITSKDRRYSNRGIACLMENVVGQLKMVDWARYQKRWLHLQGIEFPALNKKKKVDILIGANFLELLTSIKDVTGEKGAPVAMLKTPWVDMFGSTGSVSHRFSLWIITCDVLPAGRN